jgi:hypothetical protein|nr:MAG TPA: protein of unknown function (UPF0147) [Caudoviricetes sp.]
MIEKPTNTMTIKVKMTEMDEVKDIIASFIFMLEDTRIDRNIREQYLETCKPLKENFFVRIDK